MRTFFIIVALFLYSFSEGVFALTKYTPPTRDEVIRAAKPCKSGGDKKPINDKYICPRGEFSRDTSQTLSDDTIECAVQISLSFSTIDEIAAKWVKELQNSRSKNVDGWLKDINMGVNDETNALGSQYKSVCEKQNVTKDVSNFAGSCAKTTDAFPMTECESIAKKKAAMWKAAGEIIAATNIPKSYQNDKDTFMGKIKDNYEKVLDKTYRYKLMLGNAVGKFTNYISDPVK